MLSSNGYPNTGPFYRPFADLGARGSPPMGLGGGAENGDAAVAMDTTSECEDVSDVLPCPHCEFRCRSANDMTQHKWTEHPLLMKKKKHLMAPNRKRQMSENFDGKTSDLEPGEEPRMKRAASTEGKDSNDSSSDERMSPREYGGLSKSKSSSLGDIPSMRKESIPTAAEERQKPCSTVGGIAAAPFVAMYGQHMVNCIATSMLRPAEDAASAGDKLRPGREPLTVGKPQLAASATPWHPDSLAKPSSAVQSTYLSGDKLSEAFAAAANPLNGGYDFAAARLPCLMPYHVPSLLPYDAIANGGPLVGHVTQRPRADRDSSDVSGRISCSFPPSQFGNSLSALSSVASSILTNEMQPSPHVISALVPKTSSAASPRPSAPPNGSSVPHFLGMQQKMPAPRTPALIASSGPHKNDSKGEFPTRQSRAEAPRQWRAVEAETLRHEAAAKRAEDERMRSLEDALRKSDCCEVNMYNSLMPIRCPDGTWKTVRAKRIAGAWLVQMPDKGTTSVVLPHGDTGAAKRAPMPEHYTPGDMCKRLLTGGSAVDSKFYRGPSAETPRGAIMSLLLKS